MPLFYSPLGPSASTAKRHPELSPIVIHNELHARERARREQCASGPVDGPFSSSMAKRRENKPKNRYSDIAPYDRTRVIVDGEEGPEGYMQASWVEEVDGKQRWIASQAPLPSTVPTFYRFLLTSDVTTVVQLTGFIERGIQKAEPYLPTSSAPVLSLPIPGSDPLTVRWLGSERRRDSGCEVTEIELSLAGGQTKRVTHLWFMGWPDKGVPTETDELTKFMVLVEQLNATPSSPLGPPILVHCSAGVGRTGSFISIASLLRLLPLFPSPTAFPRPETSSLGPLPGAIADEPVAIVVDHCREQRLMMVETKEQVGLVWRATREAAAGRGSKA